ncbi:hypothetical protein OR16_16572 [Cupriavidus basilensis OR16]|uniref:Uncharacterized protein n=1 Tax=Cupriavidus basilensis OR16 TaxID=1127483 RepID=H1S615_9BURK|nr:hypothetical protein [Cupriavidus basilensis]EHP42058.1 hypothetical protein OR16_16572 [Cupriavidus basilensis OR16]
MNEKSNADGKRLFEPPDPISAGKPSRSKPHAPTSGSVAAKFAQESHANPAEQELYDGIAVRGYN